MIRWPQWRGFTLSAALGVAVLIGRGSGVAKSQAAPSQTRSGTFFGASADGLAWLVFVDTARGWGSLDIPPRAHQLCELHQDSGRVAIKWAPGYRNMQYAFNGRWVGNELVGEMTGTPGSREDNPVNDSVYLRRVSDTPGQGDIGRGGYYSNVTPRGGEYGGMEFLVIDAPPQPVALVTFYEGSAGPPWAAQDLVIHGDSLRFRLVREGREDAFDGIFQSRAVIISSRTLDLGRQRLNKRSTVAEVAHLFWQPGCQDSLRIT